MSVVVVCVGAALAAAGVLLPACSTDRDPSTLFAPDVNEIVVDATLIVGQALPGIWLTRTTGAGDAYARGDVGVAGASIRVIGAGDTLVYAPTGTDGFYQPFTTRIVQPATTYRLDVRLADGKGITASTTTPGALTANRWVLLDDAGQNVIRDLSTFADYGDSVYAFNQLPFSSGLLEVRFSVGNEIAYQVGLGSLDAGTPPTIESDLIDEEDLSRNVESPPLDGTSGSLRLPWFAVQYEGRYVIRVFRVDRNWYDLIRSLPELGAGIGFGGNAGDAFERPIFNINGGIGLFGSGSVDSVGVFILPRE